MSIKSWLAPMAKKKNKKLKNNRAFNEKNC